MAVCGFSFFNALFYLAAHYTTAVNIAILQGAIPVLVVLGAVALHGTRLRAPQIARHRRHPDRRRRRCDGGHVATMTALGFNRGDALMLVACALYAGYTLALRDRPAIPALAFFSALAAIAFLTSLPLVAYELVRGTAEWPTPKGWLVIAFIALFPSFLAQLSFMRGVRLIGPGRAGLFVNLAPIFGALFAVAILSEPFGVYHLIALSWSAAASSSRKPPGEGSEGRRGVGGAPLTQRRLGCSLRAVQAARPVQLSRPG